MAGLAFDVNIPSKALPVSATTVGFISTPSTQRVKLLGYGFYFDGTSNSAQPIEIKLARPTAGTLTAGGTAVKCEPSVTTTIQSTVGLAASVEPTLTASLVFKTITVHPQLGYEFLAPLGQEEILEAGTNMVFSATAPAAVNIRGYMKFEE